MLHTLPFEIPRIDTPLLEADGEMHASLKCPYLLAGSKHVKLLCYMQMMVNIRRKYNPSGIIIQITYGITESCFDFLISGRICLNAATRV